MFNIYQKSANHYGVDHDNGICVGEITREPDGFFYFWFSYPMRGCWPAYSLKEIADKLEELNKEWSDTINKDQNNG